MVKPFRQKNTTEIPKQGKQKINKTLTLQRQQKNTTQNITKHKTNKKTNKKQPTTQRLFVKKKQKKKKSVHWYTIESLGLGFGGKF